MRNNKWLFTLIPVLLAGCAPAETEPSTFTIKWMDGYNLIKEETYKCNEGPSFHYEKPSDGNVAYTFLGWSLTIGGEVLTNLPPVTFDTMYFAVFDETVLHSENKLVIMAGQSNMEGHDAPYQSGLSQSDVSDYRKGHDNVLIDYNCTYYARTGGLANTSNGNFVPVDFGQGKNTDLFGPEVGFAKHLGKNDPHNNYYIVKSAEGSSSLAVDWSATGHCYANMVNDVDHAIEYLNQHNIEFKLVGFVWMQGEADSSAASSYKNNMLALLDRINTKYAAYLPESGLSLIDGGISTDGVWSGASAINQAKKEICDSKANYRYVSASETLPKVNQYHYTARSFLTLGEKFAESLLDATK